MGPATWGTVPPCERAEHLHKLQGIISPQVTQLSIFTQVPNRIFAKASQDPKLPLVGVLPCAADAKGTGEKA